MSAASLTTKPLVSLIVPVFNEQESIPVFIDAVVRERQQWGFDTEIIFVDDGSSDQSLQQLRQAAEQHEFIQYVSFSRNFGKEIALSAGLDHAQGDAAVMLDVDLQHPLATIPEFVAKWQSEGYDMVYGLRNLDNQETWLKRATSRVFYKLFNVMAHSSLPEGGGDFRLLDRKVVDALCAMPERNRFMKGLYAWVGFKSVGIRYEQPARELGESKFNYWKLWNFALDGLVSFSTWPLRMWSYVGGVVALLAFVYASVIVIKTLIYGVDVPGYASLVTGILFLGGMQLLSIGVIGEYLGRLFVETKSRPLYVVAEKHTRSEPEADRDS
ncbi:bactoprenol glucosyl transferase [Bacterioplanes sanyensis]|uniref:glycosyltransferase family 2 protein n=1 Tax=Bacterioplanes sanyensis TaxID=1249553 RepID=UPI001675A7B9|nr:glycosyltransferase family 2 protein [Bacterioplanes sanyensis]GGY35790.1 bactoprenol glucosyl transferase [Bacterioplanes sanyensis]